MNHRWRHIRLLLPNNVAALTGFYALLVLSFSIAAISVIRTSRSGIASYNQITETSIRLSGMFLNIQREADEIQAAAVRMIFNTQPEDVQGELENIDRIQKKHAATWNECEKWLTEMELSNLFDTLRSHRYHYNYIRKKLLATSGRGNKSNVNAIEFYYSHQMAAYNDYQQSIDMVMKQVMVNIEKQMYHTNVSVSTGSGNVNLWLLISFVVMIAGSVLISRHNRKLNEIQRQLFDERQQKLVEITHQTLNAQEKERNELGKELHDNVNQLLTVAKLNLSMAADKPEKSEDLVRKSMGYVQDAIQEIRHLSKSLVNPFSNNLPFQDSVRELLSCFQSVNEKTYFQISFRSIDEEKLDAELKLSMYRIIQEQLNNIVKHADASEVYVELTGEANTLLLHIRDDGKGFDVTQKRKGIGLNNIINRAETLRGTVVIESAPGRGCALIVKVPVPVNGNEKQGSIIRRIAASYFN